MNRNKSELLYDSSVYPVSQEWYTRFKKDQLGKAIISSFLIIFILAILLLNGPPHTQKQAFGYMGLVLFGLPLSVIFIMVSILAFLGKEYLKIYEDGILLPLKGPINTILGRKKFILFNQIESIYSKHGEEVPVGSNPYPPYIYIKIKGKLGRIEKFHINEIGGKEHLDEFISIVEKKVEKVNIRW